MSLSSYREYCLEIYNDIHHLNNYLPRRDCDIENAEWTKWQREMDAEIAELQWQLAISRHHNKKWSKSEIPLEACNSVARDASSDQKPLQ